MDSNALVTVEPTEDVELINSIIRHPRIWNAVSDDDSPPREDFDVAPILVRNTSIFLRVLSGDATAGMYMLQFHSASMIEVHTCILPGFYGVVAREAAQALIRWVFAHTGCLKLITRVPEHNRLALRYAKAAGMVAQGVLTKSYLKDGRLLDQYVLGINKENLSCP